MSGGDLCDGRGNALLRPMAEMDCVLGRLL